MQSLNIEFTGLQNRSGIYLDRENEAENLVDRLTAIGYEVEEHSERWLKYCQQGHLKTSRWFAVLRNISVAICPHCDARIDRAGCQSADHVCPSCNVPTLGRTKIVKVWDGIEYGDYDRSFPLREYISIYPTWHYPLNGKFPNSPKLHESIMSAVSQVSRQDYYYQDGRRAFDKGTIEDMRVWAERYTAIDATKATWSKMRVDGPGFIEDLARLCHSAPIVRNEPNIMNSINAISNAFEGKVLADREIESAKNGANDRSLKYWGFDHG